MKKKFQTFWHVFRNSLYKPTYYKAVLPAKFSFSLKYLYLLFIIISFVSGLVFAVQLGVLYPQIPTFKANIERAVDTFYPQDLVVAIKDGKVSTNQEEPYVLDVAPGQADSPRITIDTQANLNNIANYNTDVLVTEQTIFVRENNGSFRSFSVSDLGSDFVIDKASYAQTVSQLKPYLNYMPSVLLVVIVLSVTLLPILVAGSTLLGRLVYLIITTVVLWLVAKIMKKGLSYGQVYRLSMHALTLPIVIFSLFALVGFTVPYVYTLILLVFMILVFRKLPSVSN